MSVSPFVRLSDDFLRFRDQNTLYIFFKTNRNYLQKENQAKGSSFEPCVQVGLNFKTPRINYSNLNLTQRYVGKIDTMS